jgi:hypothetical protein
MIELQVSEHKPTPEKPVENAMVDPAEIAAIEPRQNRTNYFGPGVPHVMIHLKSGKSIMVFEPMEQIKAKLAGAAGQIAGRQRL